MDKNKTNENISNSIRLGFESLSNSLVECALILSSEDYAKSFIKEREDKKKEEETKKKEETEKKKSVKENSEKFLNIYKEKLKNQLQSINISDDEKSELIRLLTTNEVNPAESNKNIDIRNSDISIKDTSQIAKKAFCDTLKEVKPEFGKMFIGDSINFDPMMLSMVIPEIKLPELTYMLLLLNNKNKFSFDPTMFMLMKCNKPF